MTREDKELLLKDLSARLPYSVKVKFNYIFTSPAILKRIDKDSIECDIAVCELEDVKPYLFPMSNMTEEQKTSHNFLKHSAYANPIKLIDFYNKHHFDWRGLISIGLALDATDKNIY